MAGRRAHNGPPREAQNTLVATRPSEFERLVRFIYTFQGRFALAFIRGDDHRQRDGVLVSLTDVLREKGIALRQIALTYREMPDLLRTLRTQCDHSHNTAVVITDIEASLKGPLLASMNLQRDLLSQEIHCPVLFWVSNFALNLIARDAPDLYDFRSTVFSFDRARGTEVERLQPPAPQIDSSVSLQTERSEEHIAYLRTQLEQYQQREDHLSHRDKMAYGELLQEVARSYKDSRHHTAALVYLNKALNLYQELQDRAQEASVWQAMGEICYFADRQSEAAENFEKTLEIYREVGDRIGEANTLKSLGDVRRMLSDYKEAETLYLTALNIHSTINDKYNQGSTLLALAKLYRSWGVKEKADSFVRQAQGFLAQFPSLATECDDLLQELTSI